jgi:hypothetical protein
MRKAYNKCYLSGVHPVALRTRIFLGHIPAIATENLLMLFFSLFTTCFSPFGPSSGETQFITYISRESYRYYNGSVVHNLALIIYLYKGKCAILKWIDYNFFK